MGYNTVLVVLNDTVGFGAKDPNLGQRILDAVRRWNGRRSRMDLHISTRAENFSAGYGRVISQEHADGHQVVIVHGNTGWRLDDPDLPESCLRALEWQLKQVKRERKVEKGE